MVKYPADAAQFDDGPSFCDRYKVVLDRMAAFYGVPLDRLKIDVIRAQSENLLDRDPTMAPELAVIRPALDQLRVIGKPALDFVSAIQEEVVGLRIFFRLNQDAVAKATGLSEFSVDQFEHLSVAELKEALDSLGPTELKEISTATVSKFDGGFDQEPDAVSNAFVGEGSGSVTPPLDEVRPASYDADLANGATSEIAVPFGQPRSDVAPAALALQKKPRSQTFWAALLGSVVLLIAVAVGGASWNRFAIDANASSDETLAANEVSGDLASSPAESTIRRTATPSREIEDVELQAEAEAADANIEVDTDTTSDNESTLETEPEEETSTSTSASTTTSTTVSFIDPVVENGGFESPQVDVESYGAFDTIDGWQSTLPVEVWATGFFDLVSPGGTQHVELNSIGPNEMTTVVTVSPGSKLQWSIDHRGREEADSMQVAFVDDNGQEETWSITTGPEWLKHQHTYDVAVDSSSLTITLSSLKDGARGNLIDNFSVDLHPDN